MVVRIRFFLYSFLSRRLDYVLILLKKKNKRIEKQFLACNVGFAKTCNVVFTKTEQTSPNSKLLLLAPFFLIISNHCSNRFLDVNKVSYRFDNKMYCKITFQSLTIWIINEPKNSRVKINTRHTKYFLGFTDKKIIKYICTMKSNHNLI